MPETMLEVSAVWRAHAAYVRRVLVRAGVAKQDLSDAQQEVYLVVQRQLPAFEQRARITTWLYSIAMNVASAQRRRAYRWREQLTAEPMATVEASGEHQMQTRCLAAHALRSLAALDEDKREVFVRHTLEDQSMVDIARALGLPLKTAFSRLYAARKVLLERLKSQGVTFGVMGWFEHARMDVNVAARRLCLHVAVTACCFVPAVANVPVLSSHVMDGQVVVAQATRPLTQADAPAAIAPPVIVNTPVVPTRMTKRPKASVPIASAQENPLPAAPPAALKVFRDSDQDLRPQFESPLSPAPFDPTPGPKHVMTYDLPAADRF